MKNCYFMVYGLMMSIFSTMLYSGSIQGSKHDLSITNYYGPEASASKEICVFCHTPHAASNALEAPLWNRKITDMGAFQMYGLEGDETVNPTKPSGVSQGCLSCHDGVLSQNAVSAVNTYDQHSLLNPPNSDTGTANCNACHPDGGVFPGEYWQIGADLTNDHPISIRYQTSFENYPGQFQESALLTGVKLFNGKVECATCHDVHDPDNGSFLRKPNANSALCMTCHLK